VFRARFSVPVVFFSALIVEESVLSLLGFIDKMRINVHLKKVVKGNLTLYGFLPRRKFLQNDFAGW
jgi:hypothetical protein